MKEMKSEPRDKKKRRKTRRKCYPPTKFKKKKIPLNYFTNQLLISPSFLLFLRTLTYRESNVREIFPKHRKEDVPETFPPILSCRGDSSGENRFP